MTRYKSILYILIALVFTTPAFNQAGIYSETDIEYQSLFFDAELAKQLGKTDDQIFALKEILRRNPEEAVAYHELSQAYFLKDEHDLAIKNAKKAVKYNSENEWFLLNLAEIYEQTKKYSAATQTYEQIVQLLPDNTIAYHRLALNYLFDNDKENALRVLLLLQQKEGITEETSRRLFDIYNDSGKHSEALDILQKLSDTAPENVRYLNNLAGYLNELGKKDQANTVYAQVLELDPNNAQASMALVKENTHHSEAGDYLTSLLPVMNNMNIPLDNKIMELMPFISRMDKNDASTPALLRISELLIELYPEEAKVYAVQGDVSFYAGKFTEAEKAYARSISLNDRKYTLWDQWMLNLWELEQYEKLRTVSFDAVDLFPNQVNAYLMHALALSQLKKTDEALGFIAEVKLIGGRNSRYSPAIQLTQTWIEAGTKEQSEIKSSLDQIKLDNAANHLFFELLGDIYKSMGDSESSKKYWEEAINRGASSERLFKKIKA